MAPGQRSYFQNPFEHTSDVTHASVFFVALMLLVGVAAILFYGNALPIPSDPRALIPADLTSSLPGLRPAATPAAAGPSPVATPGAGLAAGPAAPGSPATAPAPARTGVVANAGAAGVFLSRTPNPDDRLVAWPDGTPLQLMGEETDSQGTHWVKVTDPRGNVGWLPGQYVQAAG